MYNVQNLCNYTVLLEPQLHYFITFLMSPDNLKKCVTEIEMKPNQAYETVTRPQPARQVHTEPCAAYGVVVHTHH